MDIEKTINQLRNECLVMEEMARQFMNRCVKARTELDKLSAPKPHKKEPALSKEQVAKVKLGLRRSFEKKAAKKNTLVF